MGVEPGKVVAYRAPAEGNEWYPLPPDYPDLTARGKRDARVAVCCTQETPDDLVRAWMFFRSAYLFQGQPDGFFFDDYQPSPPFHLQMVWDLKAYPLNVIAAPRGFAKSYIIGTEIPLLNLVTNPFSKTALCVPTDRLLTPRFDTIMTQLRENERIIDDFGDLRPSRGEGSWSQHYLSLTNHARLSGFPTGGQKRGERPHMFILDDPEHDPEESTDVTILMRRFETMMFRVILPMIRKKCRVFWLGTIINRKLFLYHAIMSDDPRFRAWNRRLLAAIEYPSDGAEPLLLWPEMADRAWLEEKKSTIGPAAFSAEYLNKPVAEEDRLFRLVPELHGYRLDGDVGDWPLTSSVPITYYPTRSLADPDASIDPRTEPFGELAKGLYRVITMDYAATTGPLSDYSCILVLGVDKESTLWLLDMWMGKKREDSLLSRLFRMGEKWQVKVMGVEAVSLQRAFADRVARVRDGLAEATMGGVGGWLPRVLPVTYPGNEKKHSRIARLEWRFNRDKIKLPFDLRHEWPWRELFSQIEEFTLDMGLLVHDDAIDALAQVQYVVPTGRRTAYQAATGKPTPEELIERGIFTDADGNPLILDLTTVSREVAEKIIDKAYPGGYDEDGGETSLKTVRVRGVPAGIPHVATRKRGRRSPNR